MLRKLLFSIAIALACFTTAFAQTGSGSLQGKVIDKSTGETLPFVNLVVERNGTPVTGGSTDFDGRYSIKPLDAGKYTVKVSFVGYTAQEIAGVIVSSNKITFLDIKMSSGVDLKIVDIVKYKVPLVERDGGPSGGTVTRDDIAKMPGRSATAIATTVAGVSTDGTGGGVSIRGARTDGNFYYIDGIKVRGSSNLPKSAIQEVSVLTGGIPANYGDATGGIISITTRGPSSYYFGGVEGLTSGFINGDDKAVGLDPYARSTVEAYLSGPLLSKKNEEGEKTDPILGFFFSGNYTFTGDGQRSIIGRNYLNEDVKAQLLADPLVAVPGGNGVNYNSSFVRNSDFENVPTSKNARSKQLSLQGKIDVTTTPTINLTFGGSLNYRTATYGGNEFFNSAFNYAENEERQDLDYRVFGKFTQRFENADDKENKSLVSNAYYSIQMDYSKSFTKLQNSRNKDDYFKYGYIGKYDVLKGATPYELVTDENGNEYLRQSALPGDTAVVFTPGGVNPDLEAYTLDYYDLFNDKAGNYDQLASFVNRGLRNGDSPSRVYGIFANVGAPYGSYQQADNAQFRIQASGSADVGNHAITLGVEFEQRNDRAYIVSNLVGDDRLRNTNIWAVMRNLTNTHINELDRTDSTITTGVGQYDRVDFAIQRDAAAQTTFDRNLRIALGLDPNGTEQINIDALDPSVLSIDMFSADELLNNGNNLVTYYGYDAYGNEYNGKASVNDFFNATDENGVNTRPIGAFEPIYAAGYIMDKFTFDDIIFNVGLRVDMYDANQQVLKDKLLFRDAFQVADKVSNGQILGSDLPSNIGSDFYVYVDDVENAKSVLGYRSGNQFYNASGQPVDYTAVLSSAGTIAPWLKDASNSQNGTEPGAYTDYKPQYNFMPRIAFSFPISDEANFTAHYDILTRRPVSNNRLDIVSYNFISRLGTQVINNPNLKPEKTIDYALGFQQVLTNSSSLKIETFYRENRDQIQSFTNVGAYPRDYRSVDNLDFGTVKGFTLSYDLRRTNKISVKANYTLQFADGTGSAVGNVVNVLNTPFPSLRTIAPLNFDQRHKIIAVIDYRYGFGDNYDGPENLKNILQGLGANFVFNLGSGTPYSASSDPLNNRLDGTINGSRLPWIFRTDLQFDKDFKITVGKNKDDKPKKLNMNAYLLVNNLFNSQNIAGVYRFTGDPEDDGYLTDARYQNQINTQIDAQSYRDIYSLSRQRGGNYYAPRTIQLGVKLDF